MGLRYGLLAALTLILASALVWDRLHPPETNRLFPRDEPAREDLAVVVVGGTPEPLPPPPPPRDSGAAPAGLPAGEADAEATADDEYTVEKGDTLGQIALKTLGTSRRAAELAKFNGMSLDTPLRVGQVLRIPPSAAPAAPAAPAGPPAPSSPRGAATAPPPASRGPAAAPATPPREPAGARRSHRVAGGDSLFAIARRYYGDGTRFREIARANGLDPDDPLPVGRELTIP